MGIHHSTPAPTENDYRFVHPHPVAFLSKSIKPVLSGSTFNFELPKKSWDAKTGVGLQNGLQFAPDEPTPETGTRRVTVLQESLGKSLAVVVMENPKAFRAQICSFTPMTDNQTSCGEHQGRQLYEAAVVDKIRNGQQFTMVTVADSVHYRTDLHGPVGAHKPVKVVVKRDGLFCASLEEEKKPKQWKCTVCPGIDPALMLCFVACYDKFYQTNEELFNAAHHSTTYDVKNVF